MWQISSVSSESDMLQRKEKYPAPKYALSYIKILHLFPSAANQAKQRACSVIILFHIVAVILLCLDKIT